MIADGVAVVTGAAGGIGSAIVDHLRTRGWSVVALDLGASGGGAPAADVDTLDLADADAIDRWWASTPLPIGRRHVIVNNAAAQLCGPAQHTSAATWDHVAAVNLRAPFLMASRGLSWLLRGEHAAIVNVSSVHARATSRDISAYAASKGGLEALTRALAVEWAELGVRVNAVAPAAIDTPMLRAGLHRGHLSGDTEAALSQLAARHPLGRVGDPGDVAAAVGFLADETLSAFITGTVLSVDGGAMARLSTE